MPHTKQTTRHSQPCLNPFVRPTTMSGQQPPVTHQTFVKAPASPDEPQPTLPTQTPTTDVPAEEAPRPTPIIIQPTGSSQDEGEIEVIGQVEAEEIEEAEIEEEEEAEAEEGDVSELTEDTAAAKKTKCKRKKSKEAKEKKRSKHEKREAAGKPPKSKTPSTSTRTHPISTGLTTSVVLRQLKKD